MPPRLAVFWRGQTAITLGDGGGMCSFAMSASVSTQLGLADEKPFVRARPRG
jgi:hypothetical protein